MHTDTLLDIAMMHADSLIVNAQKGDEKALNQLVSLWYKRIYNYSYKYFGDHDYATETAQKTFIAMFRNIGKLKDINHFKPWLYRIATNCCHEEDRKAKRNNNSISINDEKLQHNGEKVDVGQSHGKMFNPEQRYQHQELEEMLVSVLGQINEEQRTIVIMKEYEGLKFKEIAEALNASESTVKTRLYAGLKRLKEILKQRNITKETVYYEV